MGVGSGVGVGVSSSSGSSGGGGGGGGGGEPPAGMGPVNPASLSKHTSTTAPALVVLYETL